MDKILNIAKAVWSWIKEKILVVKKLFLFAHEDVKSQTKKKENHSCKRDPYKKTTNIRLRKKSAKKTKR